MTAVTAAILSVFKCCYPLILLLKDKFLLSWRCSPFLWNVCWFQKKFIPYAYWSIIHLKLVVMYGIKLRSKFFSVFFFTSYMNRTIDWETFIEKIIISSPLKCSEAFFLIRWPYVRIFFFFFWYSVSFAYLFVVIPILT